MIDISVVIFTKNEEANIEACLNSVEGFSEIIVVDSQSQDKTVKIAQDFGSEVVSFNWNGKYPKKRQWSLDSIEFRNSWILFLDADERMTDNLKRELIDFLENDSNHYSAGSISLRYFFAGHELRFGQKPKKTVLLKLGSASYPQIVDLDAKGMGELEGHYQPIIKGKTKRFRSKLVHNDVDPISTWMMRHIRYADWEAHLLLNAKVKSQVDKSKGFGASLFHSMPFRPLGFFVYSYFFKLGFLDGRSGFNYAFAKSWYYWLSSMIAKEKN